MYGMSPFLFESGGMAATPAGPALWELAGCARDGVSGESRARAGGQVAAAVLRAMHFMAAAACALDEPWPPHAHLANKTWFEFIVVGGGTAGAALAARLAGRGAGQGAARVLLLEAGGDPPKDAIIPGFKEALIGSKYDWQLTTEDDGVSSQALLGGRQPQPRGRMLGGCGSINDMVYARGFPADYDRWAHTLRSDIHARHWAWDNVLPFFKKSEHLTDERIINDEELMKLHGVGGDIEVGGFNESTFVTDMFLGAFREMGFKMVKDMTSPNGIGAGRHSHTIRNGRRDSTLTALLNKQRDNPNLFVMKNAFVTNVLIENSTAYGVSVLHDDKPYHFFARHEVILTAGTFHTPKILMLSGIGPKEHLEKFNIKVVQDLPVGENLHDHVMVLNYIAAEPGTCNRSEAVPHVAMMTYLGEARGPLSVVNTMAAYYALNGSTQPNVPDFAFYPSCMPAGTQFYEHCIELLRLNENICKKLQDVLTDKELISVAVVLLNPESRGRVELSSADPLAPPAIYSGTFSDAADLHGYPEAVAVVKRMLETKYFKGKNARYVNLEIEACRGVEGEEAGVRCVARAVAMSAWHSAGTAPLGAVLDARLRVRGVRGVRVADASAMPRVVRANTNAPVHMIAEKAAHFIKAAYNC